MRSWQTHLNLCAKSLKTSSMSVSDCACPSLATICRSSANFCSVSILLRDQDLAGLQEDLEGTKSRLKDCERVKKDLEKRSKDDVRPLHFNEDSQCTPLTRLCAIPTE